MNKKLVEFAVKFGLAVLVGFWLVPMLLPAMPALVAGVVESVVGVVVANFLSDVVFQKSELGDIVGMLKWAVVLFLVFGFGPAVLGFVKVSGLVAAFVEIFVSGAAILWLQKK